MTKRIAYSFLMSCFFGNASECFSSDLTDFLPEDCQKEQANFNHNRTIIGGCQQFFTDFLTNSSGTEAEEIKQHYETSYQREKGYVYSDSPHDPDYEEKPIRSLNHIAKNQEQFQEEYLRNNEELALRTSAPTDAEIIATFTNTNQKNIYRTPIKGSDGNVFYLLCGNTPKVENNTLTPRRAGNLKSSGRFTYVNPADDAEEATEMHHLTQKGKNGVVVQLFRKIHKDQHHTIHHYPKGRGKIGVNRKDFAQELRGVRKERYGPKGMQ